MIQSVSRAVALLHAVSQRPDGAGVSELARACGLKVQTAQNLVKTLAEHHMLRFDGQARRYHLGLGLAQMADSVDRSDMLVEFVTPFLRDFYRTTGETVLATALLNNQVLLLGSHGAQSSMTLQPKRWAMKHPAEMASGRILLSHLPKARLLDVVREHIHAGKGPEPKLTVKQLLAHIDRAGTDGQAVIRNAAAGLCALAVQVDRPAGGAILSLGCNLPMVRDGDDLESALLRQLHATAERMSESLSATATPAM